MKKNNKNKNNKNRKAINKYYAIQQGNYSAFERPSITWLDPHRYVTLKYTEVFSQSIAAGVGTQQTMNLNSLFDPNRTGTGHQPYGYDQLAALYNRYRVLKCGWKVTFGTLAGTINVLVVPVNGLINTAIADAATYQTAAELPFCVVKTQGGGGGPTIVISGNMSLNKLNGVTITEYLADDRFEAAIGASPTELMTLVVGTFNPGGSTQAPIITVEMWFSVDFHDPISIGGS